ncbi:aldo/keto reductase [Muricoccus radiodurans]|uniref:aldo/keto reductase n=1 Tax=Muricoccus radiodurans TaxID=2231721 RepID=UPI003CF69B0E
MNTTRRSVLAGGAAAALAATLPGGASAQPALIRKPIPSSGEMIPIVGLGTARRYENAQAADMDPLRDTIRRFAELGGTGIDTSPTYGTAERTMGTLISELGVRDKLFLCTKVAVDNKEQGVAQIEQCFRNLRTDKIDLIAVHNLRDTANGLATLRDLKAAGRIRYYGMTTSFDRQYEEFEAVMRREQMDSIQIDYALDNRNAADRIIPLAKDRGMAVFLNLPFGRGSVFRATQGKPLPDWATEIDCTTWAQFMLKYVVSHDAVTAAMPGMAQAQYVDDNLKAAQGRLPDAAMRRRMERFIDGL